MATLTDIWRGAIGVARSASAHDFPGVEPKTTLTSKLASMFGSIHAEGWPERARNVQAQHPP